MHGLFCYMSESIKVFFFYVPGIIIEVTGSYKKGLTTIAGLMMLSFLIPFLQYCFKPWREIPQKTEVKIFTSQDELSEHKQESVPSSNVNFGFEQTELV